MFTGYFFEKFFVKPVVRFAVIQNNQNKVGLLYNLNTFLLSGLFNNILGCV